MPHIVMNTMEVSLLWLTYYMRSRPKHSFYFYNCSCYYYTVDSALSVSVGSTLPLLPAMLICAVTVASRLFDEVE